MKKGFTLIELLAVIVILGIILAIAIPSITSLVDNSRMSAYIKNEAMMLRAVRTYIAVNESLLPNNVGETIEIGLIELQNDNFIDNIKDPYDKNENCNGYVLITKIDEDNFDYNTHLKCGENRHIGSALDDGLVIHYKFDDFQEPTENLLPNIINDVFFMEEGSWYSYSSANVIIAQNVNVPEWGTTSATQIQITGGTQNLKYLTQGISSAPLGINFSSQVKIKNVGSKPVIFGTQYGFSEIINPGEIKHVFTSIIGNGTSNFQMRFQTQNVSDELEFIVFEPQIEKKGHITPFANGIRTGIIKDSSINNFCVELDLENTPRWVNDSVAGGGSYQFNGVDNHIEINDIPIGGSMTTAYWIKPFAYQRVTGGLDSRSNNAQQIRVYSSAMLQPRLYDDNGTMHNFTTQYDTSSLMGQWQHHVLTFDAITKNATLYVNGKKVLEQNFPSYVIGKGNADFVIGSQHNYINGDSVNASYDSMRLYNRELSETEIRLLYESSK